MKKISQILLIAAFGVSLIGCSTVNSAHGSVKGNVTKRMQFVVDNLVDSYNSLDSTGYRRHFGPELLVSTSPGSIGEVFRDSHRDYGKIEKFDIDASDDGRSATLTLYMERLTFDVRLRLARNGKLTQFDWQANRTSSDNSSQSSVQIDYQKFTERFVAAIRDSNLVDFYEIVSFDDGSGEELTIDDAAGMLGRIRASGEITNVLDYEVLESGELSLPITFSDSDVNTLEFIFAFSETGELSQIKLTNYAPKESIGKTLADIGADTTLTADLHSLSKLRDLYNADEGKVRFIALLSPT